MKPLVIAGIVLIALGGFGLLRGLTYPSHKNVLKVGDVQVTTDDQRPIPAWVDGIAVVGGLILIGGGMRSRPHS